MLNFKLELHFWKCLKCAHTLAFSFFQHRVWTTKTEKKRNFESSSSRIPLGRECLSMGDSKIALYQDSQNREIFSQKWAAQKSYKQSEKSAFKTDFFFIFLLLKQRASENSIFPNFLNNNSNWRILKFTLSESFFVTLQTETVFWESASERISISVSGSVWRTWKNICLARQEREREYSL